MSAPTMKDVAREAGVALGTVSKVFNQIPVGESYRIRVLDAADRLGYQVDSYARGLKTKRTCAAALLIPNIINPFFSCLADNVCRALTERGYRMVLSLTDCDPDAEQRLLRMAKQARVDGIIGLTYDPSLSIDDDLPYVSFDRDLGPGIPCVASDNYDGGRIAAEKLLELGCRRPLCFRHGSPVSGETDRRRTGFEDACRRASVPYGELWLDDKDRAERFRDYLEQHRTGGIPDYDGIFCSTDDLAVNVIRMLRDLGIRVPEDVQVIGYDGIPVFMTGELPCSTIVQPVERMAETAVALLLDPDRSGLTGPVRLPVRYAPGGTTREPKEGTDPWPAST